MGASWVGRTSLPSPYPLPQAREGKNRERRKLSFGAKIRKQQHVPYRRHVGEQHYEPIDADAEPSRRRHAVFECADVIGDEVHRLVVAGVLRLRLREEARDLILGIVELGKSVRELLRADEELEAVREDRIGIARARERRNLGRILRDESRLGQRRLDGRLEDLRQEASRAVFVLDVDAETRAMLRERRAVADLASADLGIERAHSLA